jgi:hypothetical protein
MDHKTGPRVRKEAGLIRKEKKQDERKYCTEGYFRNKITD